MRTKRIFTVLTSLLILVIGAVNTVSWTIKKRNPV